MRRLALSQALHQSSVSSARECGEEAISLKKQAAFWELEAKRLMCVHHDEASGTDCSMLRLTERQPMIAFSSDSCDLCSSAMETRLQRLELEAQRWRKEVGRLSCKYESQGPTGGFCMYGGRPPNAGGTDDEYMALLVGILANSTVLDVGCGVGNYGRYFSQHAPTVKWTGVDGSEGIEEATSGFVRFADLAAVGLPRSLRQTPWDWTLSMQVAEHIPPRAEAAFMHTLVRHARHGVILGWAGLAQQGVGHANSQPVEYVRCAMRYAGFTHDNSYGGTHLQNVVFRKQGRSRVADTNFMADYRDHTRRHCGYTTWGYLAAQPRLVRQLAARRAILGELFSRRACDVSTPQTEPSMWRNGEYAWWRMSAATRTVDALANTSGVGMAGLRDAELDLYEVLATQETSLANRAVLSSLAKQRFASPGSVAGEPPVVALSKLTAQGASIEVYRRWLNNTVWGMCLPPKESFCFYSRSLNVRYGKSRNTPRGFRKDCVL